jgi:hypothetical protein
MGVGAVHPHVRSLRCPHDATAGAGALAVVWMLAANAISLGVLLRVLGFRRVRSARHRKLAPA